MRLLYLLLLACTGIYPVLAQEDILNFFNISREDGLAQATVTCMLEGSDGFMWIGTAEGLHRYDGYDFRIFKNNLRDSNSLSNDHVTAICEGRYDVIWVGTYTGELNRFNKRTGTCERIRLRDADGAQNAYPITTMFLEESGELLVGLDGGGIVRYQDDKETQQNLNGKNSGLINNYVKSFNADAGRIGVWVTTAQGLCLYRNGRFERPNILSLFDNQYVSDILSTDGFNYITTAGQGLFRWDVANNLIESVQTPRFRGARFLTFVLQDALGTLWVGTEGGGVLRFEGNEIHRYRQDPFNNRSLISDYVVTGLCDSRGMVWLGCIDGLSQYDPSYQLFRVYRTFEYQGKAVNNNIYCIYEDKEGIMWLGTLSGGLIRFTPSTGATKVFPTLKDGEIETRAVRSVYEDSRGTLWVGSRDEGLWSFDRSTERFRHHTPSKKINLKTIRCIYEDSEKNLWLGSNWGLIRYNRDRNDFEVYSTRYHRNNPIYQILEDATRKELIICTFRSGLHLFHKEREAFTVIQHDNDTMSPSVNALMCIEALGDDQYLIGTYGGGINHFNRKTLQFRAITNMDGLPNNVVYGILRQDEHTCWLSTNDGIVRYRMDSGTFRRYGLNYYLQGLEFNEGAYCKSRSGTFYFGGTEGFNTFRPETFSNITYEPRLVLTGFRKLNSEVILGNPLDETEVVEVDYNENLITLTFAALNFSRENSYAYKLQGFDNDWIYTGRDRAAYYTRLAPGSYIFKMKVANADGVYGNEVNALRIIVRPPYWRTWWFFGILGLVLVGAVIGLVTIRTKAVSRAYKHRLLELEMRALRSQMNPHFIFNSLNSIQYYVLKNEPRQAYNYLTKFSSLMRMILQNSRRRFISLHAEIDWLRTYLDLEKLRMENEMVYTIEMDDRLDAEQIFVPSMLLQPYVENAIIHGLLPKEGERLLNIRFQREHDRIRCTISDNGIGRVRSRELNAQRSRKHKSQGLELTGERLEMLSTKGKPKGQCIIRDLYGSDGKATGTEVELILPIIRQADLDE
ncbi:MAG: histidine kinase [Flavobacteriales bacterium]|nr:histidine kinase [Flavobacteriales bacterium]